MPGPAGEELVFFGLRPWRELAAKGLRRTAGETLATLLASGRFAASTYVHVERRWGARARREHAGELVALGLPAGAPLSRLPLVRRWNRRLQGRALDAALRRDAGGPRLWWLTDWWQAPLLSPRDGDRLVLDLADDTRRVFVDEPSRLAEDAAHRRAAAGRIHLVAAVDRELLAGVPPGPARVLAPNAIAASFLAAAVAPAVEPPELAGVGRPRLVVTAGHWSLEQRLDHELLGAALERLPGWTLVLVGLPAGRRPSPPLAALLARRQVVALAERRHDELPALLRAADVAAVPYRPPGGGRDPLKTYEYLACGLPVVLTVDAAPDGLEAWTACASDAASFADACRRLLERPRADAGELRRRLAERSWEGRTAAILAALDLAVAPAGPALTPPCGSACPAPLGRPASSSSTRAWSTSATMIWPTSWLTSRKMPVRLHLRASGSWLSSVGRDVVHRVGLVAVDEAEVDERHQALLAQRLGEGVLVAHGEDAAAAAVVDGREDHVGAPVVRRRLAEDQQLEQLRAGAVRAELHAQLARRSP